MASLFGGRPPNKLNKADAPALFSLNIRFSLRSETWHSSEMNRPKPKEPCPKCGKKEAVQKDCGYTTFNPVWVECTCGYSLDGTVGNWDRIARAMRSKAKLPKRKQELANTLARLMTTADLEELVKAHGKTWG